MDLAVVRTETSSAACGDRGGGEAAPALASMDGLNTVMVTTAASWLS